MEGIASSYICDDLLGIKNMVLKGTTWKVIEIAAHRPDRFIAWRKGVTNPMER